MRRVRVIPVLLLHNGAVVKSVKFKKYQYVGDPINAVKILNEKEVDELVVLDIDASRENRQPNIKQIREIAGEAFMPLTYGGGISKIQEIEDLFYIGVEKIILNSSAVERQYLVAEATKLVGSQSVVVSIDVKKDWRGRYKVFTLNGMNNTGTEPWSFAKSMEDAGCGEILLNSIDRDGTYGGFDVSLIQKVSNAVKIPVVACGGAASLVDFREAILSGASAAAAGSYFVFQRPHNAVLVTYPSQEELQDKIYSFL